MGGNGSKVETPVPRKEARIQGSPEAQEWVEACAQKTFDWVLDEMKPDPKHDLKYVAPGCNCPLCLHVSTHAVDYRP